MDVKTVAYLAPNAHNAAILRELREALRDTLDVARSISGVRRPDSTELPPPLRAAGREAGPWLLRVADPGAAVAAGVLLFGGWRQVLVAAAVVVAAAQLAGRYRWRLELSVLADVPALVLAAAVGGLAFACSGAGTGALRAISFTGAVFLLQAGVRVIGYAGARTLRRSRRGGRAVVIVGAGATAERLAAAMLARPELGLRPVGFVVPDGSAAPARTGLPVLDARGGLPRLARALGVRAAFVAAEVPVPQQTLGRYRRAGLDVFVIAEHVDAVERRCGPVEVVWGMPIVRLGPPSRGELAASITR